MTPLLTCWTFVLCLCLPSVLAAGGVVTVNCVDGCVKDKFWTDISWDGQKPFFSMDDNEFNYLTHDIRVNPDTCHKEFKYRAKGIVDNKVTENPWKWNETIKNIENTIPVKFGKENEPNNCQDISITLVVDGKNCKNQPLNKGTLVDTINPLKEWIEAKERKEKKYSVKEITLEDDGTANLSWEEITSSFKTCNFESMSTKGSIKYTAQRNDNNKENKPPMNVTGTSFKGMFETQKYPKLNKEEQCFIWSIQIEVKLDFYLSEISTTNLAATFKRQTEKVFPSNLNLEIMKKNNESITTTYLKIKAIDKPELRCLENEANIELKSNDVSNGMKQKIPIKYDSLNKTAKVNLEIIPDKKCVESQALIQIFDLEHKTIAKELIRTHPELLCTKSENTIKLSVTNEQFEGCDLTYRISCPTWNSTSPNDEEYIDQKESEFTIENLQDKNCSVIAFMKEPNDEKQWFYKRPLIPCYEASPKVAEPASVGVIVASVIISTIVAVGAAFVYQRSRSKKRAARKPVHRISIKEAEDAHFIINKKNETNETNDDHIKETLRSLVEQQDDVGDEFNKADDYSRREIVSKESTMIAKNEVNKFRNRYTDMVPYDSNIIHLKMKTGNPASTYMNASRIKFEGMKQDFVAIQAPKPPMFGSFWQLVWEQNVSVIVMITGLVEGGRTKAHQYWPDKDEIMMDFGQVGLTVKYESHSYPGTYFHRKILITNDKGQEKIIDHLQTNEWADMAAPRTTKILLDLYHKSDELMDERTGPIMVHCSAGVGRTGTYIGLYKLINDYNDDSVEKIDFYQTLIEMRKQRMMMIQKPVQYHYMIKCLSDFVASETSDYA